MKYAKLKVKQEVNHYGNADDLRQIHFDRASGISDMKVLCDCD